MFSFRAMTLLVWRFWVERKADCYNWKTLLLVEFRTSKIFLFAHWDVNHAFNCDKKASSSRCGSLYAVANTINRISFAMGTWNVPRNRWSNTGPFNRDQMLSTSQNKQRTPAVSLSGGMCSVPSAKQGFWIKYLCSWERQRHHSLEQRSQIPWPKSLFHHDKIDQSQRKIVHTRTNHKMKPRWDEENTRLPRKRTHKSPDVFFPTEGDNSPHSYFVELHFKQPFTVFLNSVPQMT